MCVGKVVSTFNALHERGHDAVPSYWTDTLLSPRYIFACFSIDAQEIELWPRGKEGDNDWNDLSVVPALASLGLSMEKLVSDGRGLGCKPLFRLIQGKTIKAAKRLLLREDYKTVHGQNLSSLLHSRIAQPPAAQPLTRQPASKSVGNCRVKNEIFERPLSKRSRQVWNAGNTWDEGPRGPGTP